MSQAITDVLVTEGVISEVDFGTIKAKYMQDMMGVQK